MAGRLGRGKCAEEYRACGKKQDEGWTHSQQRGYEDCPGAVEGERLCQSSEGAATRRVGEMAESVAGRGKGGRGLVNAHP